MSLLLFFISCLLNFSTYCVVDWSPVDNIIQEAINNGLFSGSVLGVANINSTYLKKAYGTTIPKRGFYAPSMQVTYKFDINRLTQIIGTNSVLMELYDLGSGNLTRKISAVLSDFNNNGKSSLTLDNMLLHNSGFPSEYTAAFPATPALLLKNIEGLKLNYTLETKFQYSEIGYTVLGHFVQKVKKATIKDSMFQVLTLAGLRDTGFIPTTSKDQIIPGGYNNGICQGIPSNKYSHFLNNMSGNAGLFSTVDNLITYMQLMLNKGKMPGLSRVFSQQVINLYTTPLASKKYNNTFARGWQTVSSKSPSCGHKFSKDSFGLADPSGSYIWADKQKNVTIILLANGNFPVQRQVPAEFQGKLSDAIMTILGH